MALSSSPDYAGDISAAEAWDKLKTEWRSQERTLTQAQLADLKSAVKRYENQLKEHPTASSAPYARLNLAQVLTKAGSLQESEKSAEISQWPHARRKGTRAAGAFGCCPGCWA